MCFAISSIVFRKRIGSNIPVGLVNERNPLGHSGQRRLQEVVGSIEIPDGKDIKTGFFKYREA